MKLINFFHAINQWRQSEMDNKFNPQLDDEFETTLKLLKSPFYIPIKGYNPDSLSETQPVVLVKTIMDEIANHKGKKRYLILGGSGMGKSTFSASFFYTYINSHKFKKPPFPIYVQYLGDERWQNAIEQIINDNHESIASSILILDALDESKHAYDDKVHCWEMINALTHDFKAVIITCRSHFFDNEDSEPNEGRIWVNSANGLLKYQKYYISPFSDDEIQKYLQSRYRIESEDYQKAKIITDKCKDLTIRPMVLQFVDYIKDYKGISAPPIVEIYYRIVYSWFERECRHLSAKKKNETISSLFKFSKQLAAIIYNNDGRLYLTANEFQSFLIQNGYQSSPISFKERSLVNRTSEGYIKFSHKSFYEYFIAINSIENPGKPYNLGTLDVASTFATEIYKLYLQEKEFWFIDYYEPHFLLNTGLPDLFRFNTSDWREGKKNLKDYWIMFIQRSAYQFINVNSFYSDLKKGLGQKTNNDERETLLLSLELMKAALDTQQLIEITQEWLLKSNQLCEDAITAIDSALGNFKGKYREMLIDSAIRKEKLVLPYLFELSDEIQIDTLMTLTNNYVSIGSGVCSTSQVCKAIKWLHKRGKCDQMICIYRDIDTIEESLKFINEIKYVDTKPQHIVFVFNHRNNQIVFDLNRISLKYDDGQILTFLQNQLEDA